jgi:UDP-N-acetylglucosamine 2-epimerase (non-hydrolysing)
MLFGATTSRQRHRHRPMHILSVVGARPNFMKLAPLDRELAGRAGCEHLIVHTGQHYDRNMSDSFFDDLGIPEPHYNLEVGSASHAQQTGAIMQRFEPVCLEVKPEVVLVYGDVNSTVAAALVASKLGIKVGHVEAGLRSRDWSMPEEINRVVTDRLSDFLFTPSPDADDNLRNEGVAADRIHHVGNIMIDSLVYALPRARELRSHDEHDLPPGEYCVVTLHRPSNVDDPATLRMLMDTLSEFSRHRPVVFPVHPRTRGRIGTSGWQVPQSADLRLVEPIAYIEMLSLVASAGTVITDSGGLQEETSYLGVPCVTIRPNTERPITCSEGTNQLVAPDREAILEAVGRAEDRRISEGAKIDKWDGRTAERIADILVLGSPTD